MAVRFFVEYIKTQMQEILKYKWFLSEKAGRDVGSEEAIRDFVAKGHAARFHDEYFKEHKITALDFEMENVLNGDSCVIIELRATAHNHETGKEVVLEDEVLRYCFGGKEDCPHRNEISPGLYECQRPLTLKQPQY